MWISFIKSKAPSLSADKVQALLGSGLHQWWTSFLPALPTGNLQVGIWLKPCGHAFCFVDDLSLWLEPSLDDVHISEEYVALK